MTPEERAESLVNDWLHKEVTVADRVSPAPVERLESMIAAAIREAVAEERERCAAIISAIEPIGVGLDRDEMGRGYVLGIKTGKERAIDAIRGKKGQEG